MSLDMIIAIYHNSLQIVLVYTIYNLYVRLIYVLIIMWDIENCSHDNRVNSVVWYPSGLRDKYTSQHLSSAGKLVCEAS